jgi:hypothetical protein
MKSPHDARSQTQGFRLEKDILPDMTGLDHRIPFSSGAVFARNPAIF